MRCPICRLFIERSNPEFPFCSARCRTLDLGNWASERYVISSPVQDDDEEERVQMDPSDVE
jgi:uncharacterized protein